MNSHEYAGYYDPLLGGDVYICPVCGRTILVAGAVKTVICAGDETAAHSGTVPPAPEPADPPEFEAWATAHRAELEALG